MTMYELEEDKITVPSFDEIERKLLQIKDVRTPDLAEQIDDLGYTIKHIRMTIAAIQGTAQYALKILRELKAIRAKEKEGAV